MVEQTVYGSDTNTPFTRVNSGTGVYGGATNQPFSLANTFRQYTVPQTVNYSNQKDIPLWQKVIQGAQNVLSFGQTPARVQLNANEQLYRMQNQLEKTYATVEKIREANNAKGSDQVNPEDLKVAFRNAASSEGKQYGGWYDNPATGRNQRYWGNGVWTDGEEPGFNSVEKTAQDIANLAPTMPEIPPFMFDYIQAERDAIEKLTPYYEELIEQADGDFELARSRLLEDWNTGRRQLREDFNTITQQVRENYAMTQRMTQENLATGTRRADEDYMRTRRQAVEDFLSQSEEYNRLEPEEQAKVLDSLNRRGMLQSTIKEQEYGNLTDRQRARREAIQRAMERKEQLAVTEQQRSTQDLIAAAQRAGEQAKLNYQRGLGEAQTSYERGMGAGETEFSRGKEDLDIQQPRVIEGLQDKMTEEAADMVELQRQRKFDTYMQEQLQNLGSYIA